MLGCVGDCVVGVGGVFDSVGEGDSVGVGVYGSAGVGGVSSSVGVGGCENDSAVGGVHEFSSIVD